MKQETVEWIDKAEGDLKVAAREIQTADPVYHVICFLAQQCAEKYLKALLEEHNLPYSKSHDLVALIDKSHDLFSELSRKRERLAHLSQFGIAARYPGMGLDREDAEESMSTALEVRATVRLRLGLERS